jgi:membrane fusion protein (multidrug efflux system)
MRRMAMVVLLGVGVACGGEPVAEETEPTARAAVVIAAPVETAEVVDALVLSGEASPWAAVDLVAEASGRIVALPAEIGRRVASGAVVARLDDESERVALDQARAALQRAETSARQTARDLERGESLAATRDISDGELDRLRLAADTDRATVAEARAGVRMAETRVADMVITAPFAGVIADRRVDLGAWVGVGTPVCRLVASDRLKVRSAAAPDDRPRLRVGMPVAVRSSALPGHEFSGSIRLLGEEADAVTGTYLVEVAVPEPSIAGAVLLPGMRVQATVELERRTSLVVPRQALVSAAGEHHVVVAEEGTARRLPVTPGVILEDRIEIVSGLEGGGEVLVQGHLALADGDAVEVLER